MTTDSPPSGFIPTDDQVEEAEEAKRRFREEYIRKQSESHKGLPISNLEEFRKMGFKKGSTAWNKGLHLSETHKNHISIGYKKSYQNGRVAWGKGTLRGEETRAKLRAAMINRHPKPSRQEREIGVELTRLGIEWKGQQQFPNLLPSPYKHHPFDITVYDKKIIIEVNGCGIHGCPIHYPNPSKFLLKNIVRDRVIRESFKKQSEWTLIELWQHDIDSDMTIEYLLHREIPQLFTAQ
jgi:hypothetical protein